MVVVKELVMKAEVVVMVLEMVLGMVVDGWLLLLMVVGGGNGGNDIAGGGGGDEDHGGRECDRKTGRKHFSNRGTSIAKPLKSMTL